MPATVRDIAGAPDVPDERGPVAARLPRRRRPRSRATVSVSENWGFASFETDRYKLVVDEDALRRRASSSTSHDDPNEDDNRVADPECKAVVEELMETFVRPFLATPPARPHPSVFTP